MYLLDDSGLDTEELPINAILSDDKRNSNKKSPHHQIKTSARLLVILGIPACHAFAFSCLQSDATAVRLPGCYLHAIGNLPTLNLGLPLLTPSGRAVIKGTWTRDHVLRHFRGGCQSAYHPRNPPAGGVRQDIGGMPVLTSAGCIPGLAYELNSTDRAESVLHSWSS